jgi:hypothetical protein
MKDSCNDLEESQVDELFETIRQNVLRGRYIVGQHAAERLEERGILEWQIVDGITNAKLIIERPKDQPNPSIETEQLLADGTAVKAVWSHLIRQFGQTRDGTFL